jgi:hypothetical protein
METNVAKEIDDRDYLAEFLAAGKSVTVVPAGQRTDPENITLRFTGGRGRPKKVEAEPTKKSK